MSRYEDYSRTSGAYDRTRGAVGVEIIAGCLARGPVPLARQSLLDAGCGTGNYSRALIGMIERIVAMDLNADMLLQARAKFKQQEKRIRFCRSRIERLPFAAGVFDGVMVNQVLHHLHDPADEGYGRIEAVLSEFARVLKPGAVLVINICSQRQIEEAFWYCHLIPEEAARMQARHIPLPRLADLLELCGFSYGGCIVPVDALLQGREYFNPLGPCDASWRDGDSIWSTVPQRRIDAICRRLKRLGQCGELERFVAVRDGGRKDIGQISFMHARKR